MSLLEVRHISVSIARPPADVYAFAADPQNMPRWASGLGTTFRRNDAGDWIAEGGPVGKVKVHFTPPNDLGVLDHDVTLESGAVVHNPIRVVPNGREGSEITFTLFRQPDMSDAELERDAAKVASDLATLKSLVERA